MVSFFILKITSYIWEKVVLSIQISSYL